MSSKREVIAKHRVESASRSQKRKLEQAMLQVNSHQPITKAQQALPSEDVELYNNVNVQHVINGTDFAWNHLESMPKKQIDIVFLPQTIAGMQNVYCVVKKKYNAEMARREQMEAERIQKNQEKHHQFEQRKLKNGLIYAKLGLKKTYQSAPATQFTEEPLFQRLSKPKQSFIQQSTYDLPDFRGLPIKNLTYVDKYKNPILINHFMSSNLLPKSVNKDKIRTKFETSDQKLEKFQNTIQVDEMNLDNDFKDNAMLEIDQFEKMLSTMPQTMYSQVKDRENQLLQSVEGFRSIRKIKRDPNYRHIIGNQIRDQILQKQ
ncbi:unnamed protein product (macronuclear) [Paramecium tetraurelia]|uniref:Uncharacterized protein n=1 Tax=Paramecium tetraurelia TaxID=5888 RepID=A0E6V3_PARTE|nr:uncharacterized protein GSPATT00023748001 [Paramecium tetraurelia]CAK91020.1 unnamed protein product [Paramecium tetraurelia]|eukprot:XP_001458417.1 hypothetical protein (macronuclear) [Paramecium tetraurelia strain d4-2]